jgi:hypothetical protein
MSQTAEELPMTYSHQCPRCRNVFPVAMGDAPAKYPCPECEHVSTVPPDDVPRDRFGRVLPVAG